MALARGDLNGAWDGLFAAQEREVETCSDVELSLRSAELLQEADAKLEGHWRGRAIRALLDWVPTKPPDGPAYTLALDDRRQRLSAAMRLRNESYSNTYRRLDHMRLQLAMLAGAGLLIAVALVLLVATGVVPVDANGVPSRDQVWGVVLFGALGGSFSGTLSLLKVGLKPIPQTLAEGWATLMRPAIGAVGALAAFAFLVAGVLGIDGAQAAYAVSFAAGFSERLVSRAAESLSG